MDTTFAPSCLVSRPVYHKVALFEAAAPASKSLSSKQVLYVDLYHCLLIKQAPPLSVTCKLISTIDILRDISKILWVTIYK